MQITKNVFMKFNLEKITHNKKKTKNLKKKHFNLTNLQNLNPI